MYLIMYLHIYIHTYYVYIWYTVYIHICPKKKKTQSRKLPTGYFRSAATSLRCALKNLTTNQHNRWRNQIGHSVHSNHVVGRTCKNYISLPPTARTNLRIQGLQKIIQKNKCRMPPSITSPGATTVRSGCEYHLHQWYKRALCHSTFVVESSYTSRENDAANHAHLPSKALMMGRWA